MITTRLYVCSQIKEEKEEKEKEEIVNGISILIERFVNWSVLIIKIP